MAGLGRWIDHSLLEGHCVDVRSYRRKKKQDDFLEELVRASCLYVSDRYLLRLVDTSVVEIVVVVAAERSIIIALCFVISQRSARDENQFGA